MPKSASMQYEILPCDAGNGWEDVKPRRSLGAKCNQQDEMQSDIEAAVLTMSANELEDYCSCPITQVILQPSILYDFALGVSSLRPSGSLEASGSQHHSKESDLLFDGKIFNCV